MFVFSSVYFVAGSIAFCNYMGRFVKAILKGIFLYPPVFIFVLQMLIGLNVILKDVNIRIYHSKFRIIDSTLSLGSEFMHEFGVCSEAY